MITNRREILILVISMAALVSGQPCKPPFANCRSIGECCSTICSKSKCLTKYGGEECGKNQECFSNSCKDGKCVCKELEMSCTKYTDCCSGACEKGKCLIPYEEDCKNDADCVGGECDKDDECTCHENGQFCIVDDQCCSEICKNMKCQCVPDGKTCALTGKYCCNSKDECKAKNSGNTPFCGKCKNNGEPCTKDEECCKFNCHNNKCTCNMIGGKCRTKGDCCNPGAHCLRNTENKYRCLFLRKEDGMPCVENGECISTYCFENKICKCLASGKSCQYDPVKNKGMDEQCCSNICTLQVAETKKFVCY